MKVCSICEEDKPFSAFTRRSTKRANDYQPYCNSCRSIMRKDFARKNKALAIAYKGGSCNDCTSVVHQAAFEFHHIDPAEKDTDPCHLIGTGFNGLTERAKTELDKCVLLCANCHRIRHYNE
jgi:hypothetical protein